MKKKKIEKLALGILAGTAAGHVITKRSLEEHGLSRPEGLDNNGMVEPDFIDNFEIGQNKDNEYYEIEDKEDKPISLGIELPDFEDSLSTAGVITHNTKENLDPDKMVEPDFEDNLRGLDKVKKPNYTELIKELGISRKENEANRRKENAKNNWRDEPDNSDAWKIGGAIAGATIAVGAAGTAAGIAIKKHHDNKNKKESQELQEVEEQKIEKPSQEKKAEEKDITEIKINIDTI